MAQSKFLVEIRTIDNAKKFVAIVRKFHEEVDIKQGRYTIDGKSIMGLFSLDITKPIWVEIKTHDSKRIVEFYHRMEEFVVESSRAESRDPNRDRW